MTRNPQRETPLSTTENASFGEISNTKFYELIESVYAVNMTSIRKEYPDIIHLNTNKNIGTNEVQCLMKIITINYRPPII